MKQYQEFLIAQETWSKIIVDVFVKNWKTNIRALSWRSTRATSTRPRGCSTSTSSPPQLQFAWTDQSLPSGRITGFQRFSKLENNLWLWNRYTVETAWCNHWNVFIWLLWSNQSRCDVRQFFLRQLFWFSSTIEEWVIFRLCFCTCHWSK